MKKIGWFSTDTVYMVLALIGIIAVSCAVNIARSAEPEYFAAKRVLLADGTSRPLGLYACTVCPKGVKPVCVCEPVLESTLRRQYPRQTATARTVTPRVRVVATPLTVRRVAVPAMTVVQQPAPAYSIVETPREPFVVNGLFRDRVVVPRRMNLSVEKQ